MIETKFKQTEIGSIPVDWQVGTFDEAVRNAFQVKKVTSSHTKKQTVIIAEQDIPEQGLKDVVAKAG